MLGVTSLKTYSQAGIHAYVSVQLGPLPTSLFPSKYAGQTLIVGSPPLAARGWGAIQIRTQTKGWPKEGGDLMLYCLCRALSNVPTPQSRILKPMKTMLMPASVGRIRSQPPVQSQIKSGMLSTISATPVTILRLAPAGLSCRVLAISGFNRIASGGFALPSLS